MKAQFHDIGANVDIFHEEWYKVALEVAEKVIFYNTDFVFVKNITAELDLWEPYWTKELKGNLPTTVSDTLDALNELNPYSYPTVFEALKIIAVLPSTSCSSERSISSLRHLKDYTQSTMKSDRLNGLASMYIHRNIYVNPSFVLEKFVLANPNGKDNFGIVDWFRKVCSHFM